MTLTQHGHHIPLSPTDDEIERGRMRCGGPRLCNVCKTDSVKWAQEKEKDEQAKQESARGR